MLDKASSASPSSLFIAHGSPMFAIRPGVAGEALSALAEELGRPRADVPVVPLSIQHHGGPQHAYRIGQALAPLTAQGWLIVATGNITHNLRDWRQAGMGLAIDSSYAQRFSDWIHGQLISGNTPALLDYRQGQADALRAQPRDEHLLPLFTALGAAGAGASSRAIHRGISDHVIAMDSYAFVPVSA